MSRFTFTSTFTAPRQASQQTSGLSARFSY